MNRNVNINKKLCRRDACVPKKGGIMTDRDKERLKIYDLFFSYLNPISISNEIIQISDDDDVIINDDRWNADIGGIKASGINAVDAMENVINKINE